MEAFLQSCGYIAAAIGTFLEGEVFLITAVVSAKAGYFNLRGAFFFSFLGSWLHSLITFFVARKSGKTIFKKHHNWPHKFDRVNDMIEKRPLLVLLFYRLFYGLVTATTIVFALSHISSKKFVLFSVLSNLIRVSFYGTIAYFCADLLLNGLSFLGAYVGWGIAGLAILGLIVFLIRKKTKHLWMRN